jgi:hypothetical protein
VLHADKKDIEKCNYALKICFGERRLFLLLTYTRNVKSVLGLQKKYPDVARRLTNIYQLK